MELALSTFTVTPPPTSLEATSELMTRTDVWGVVSAMRLMYAFAS